MDYRNGQDFNPKVCVHRIEAQLDTLIEQNVRYAVLSAFGCGAFLNPTEFVAKAYHDALLHPR